MLLEDFEGNDRLSSQLIASLKRNLAELSTAQDDVKEKVIQALQIAADETRDAETSVSKKNLRCQGPQPARTASYEKFSQRGFDGSNGVQDGILDSSSEQEEIANGLSVIIARLGKQQRRNRANGSPKAGSSPGVTCKQCSKVLPRPCDLK